MRLEPIKSPTLVRKLVPPAIALISTVVIASLLAMVAGANPFSVIGLILKGSFGSQFATLETLNRATPLIFTGLAVAVAFRAKFWNIGAEAQLYAGALMTVLLGTGVLPWPSFAILPLIIVASILAGAIVLLVPALLKTRFGVTDSLDPTDNIKGGVAYLDWLMGEFDRDPILVLAGYNAGEGAVRTHEGVPPYAETRVYVPKVLAAWQIARGLCMTPPELVTDGCVFSVSGG